MRTQSHLCYDARKIKAKLLDSLPEQNRIKINSESHELRCMLPLTHSSLDTYYEYTLTLTVNGLEIELQSIHQKIKLLENDFNKQLSEHTHIRLALEESEYTLPSNSFPIRYKEAKIKLASIRPSDSISIDKTKNKPIYMKEGETGRLEVDLNNAIADSLMIKDMKVVRDHLSIPQILCSDVRIVHPDEFTHISVRPKETRSVKLYVDFLKRMHYDTRVSAELVGVNLEPDQILTIEAEGGYLCPKEMEEGLSLLANKYIEHPNPVSCPKQTTIGPFDKHVLLQFMVVAGEGLAGRKFSSGVVTLKLTKNLKTL